VHAGGALSVAYSAIGLNKSSQDALEEAARFGLISAQLLADEGFRLLRVGAYPEAEVQLAKGLQVDSSCEDAFYRLGNALLIQGKSEPALEVLAYGIEQSPEYPPFYRLMSEIYTTRGQHKEAAAFLKRALEISPRADDADMLQFMLATALYHGGRSDSAISTLRDLLEQHPRTLLKRNVKARIAALEKKAPDAKAKRIANFPRKLQKRSYCAPNTLANVLSFCGVAATQDDVAARVMRGAGTRWPEMIDYLKDVEGIAFRGFFGTLDMLRRCIDNDLPVITTEYYGMSGHALAIIGYDDEAEILIAQDPRFYEPVEISYGEFQRSWMHDDGLSIAVAPAGDKKKLPQQSGDEERLVRQFIELLRKRAEGDHDATLKPAMELSSEAPEKQAPIRILAEIALERRHDDRLKQLCEDTLAKWPECFWARRHLGDAMWMSGQPEEARAHYRTARRLDRRDESLSYALGELLLSMDRRDRGRAFLLKALGENPRYHKARLRLASDLNKRDENDIAEFHARLLVEYEPDNAQARELLTKLSGNTAVRTLSEGARKVAEELANRPEPPEPDTARAQSDDDEEIEIDLEDL
jgi:tetratricopeptide (TPR) repeat protein